MNRYRHFRAAVERDPSRVDDWIELAKAANERRYDDYVERGKSGSSRPETTARTLACLRRSADVLALAKRFHPVSGQIETALRQNRLQVATVFRTAEQPLLALPMLRGLKDELARTRPRDFGSRIDVTFGSSMARYSFGLPIEPEMTTWFRDYGGLQPTAAAHCEIGEALCEAGNPKAAVREFEAAIAENAKPGSKRRSHEDKTATALLADEAVLRVRIADALLAAKDRTNALSELHRAIDATQTVERSVAGERRRLSVLGERPEVVRCIAQMKVARIVRAAGDTKACGEWLFKSQATLHAILSSADRNDLGRDRLAPLILAVRRDTFDHLQASGDRSRLAALLTQWIEDGRRQFEGNQFYEKRDFATLMVEQYHWRLQSITAADFEAKAKAASDGIDFIDKGRTEYLSYGAGRVYRRLPEFITERAKANLYAKRTAEVERDVVRLVGAGAPKKRNSSRERQLSANEQMVGQAYSAKFNKLIIRQSRVDWADVVEAERAFEIAEVTAGYLSAVAAVAPKDAKEKERREWFARRAIELLNSAAVGRVFRDAAKAERVKTHAGFASLRQSKDFAALLKQLDPAPAKK